MLGLANVFLKPLLTFIALPLILLTFGIAYFFVNVVVLLFTEWVVPDFSIDGFWTLRRRDDRDLARQLARLAARLVGLRQPYRKDDLKRVGFGSAAR